MVRGMAGRGDCLQQVSVRVDDFSIGDNPVRHEARVRRGVDLVGRVARLRIHTSPERGQDRRAGRSLKRPGARSMIAMGVRNQDVPDSCAADRA